MLGKAQWQNLSGRHLQTSCSACESTRVALISGSGCSAPRVSHPPPGTQGQLWHIILLKWLKANGLLRWRLLRHTLWTGNSVQFSGCCVWLFLTPWTATCQASLSITNSWGLTQTYVHWGGDAIQPSHPLSSPAPAFNISQHQGLFQWVSSSNQVAKILEFQLHHQSFQWIFRTELLWDGLIGSPHSPRDSQESSPTPQFKSINSLRSAFFSVQLSHPYMTTGKTIALTIITSNFQILQSYMNSYEQTLNRNCTRKGIVGNVVSRLRHIWQWWGWRGSDAAACGGDKLTVDNLAS